MGAPGNISIADMTKHDLQEAARAIASTISKCEKAQTKLAPGTSSHTLTKNRLKAFYIAMALIERELGRPEGFDGGE